MRKKTAPAVDWQRLWFATRQQPWTSLAIIPSDSGVDAKEVAESLVATGQIHGERPVSLLNALSAQLGDVQRIVDTIASVTSRGEWIIVPVDPISDNPTTIPIVRSTTAALLVVRLGQSLLTSSRTALEAIGRDRFIGSIVLSEKRGKPPVLHLT